MFKLYKEQSAETAVKTADLSQKVAQIGNAFAVFAITMLVFSSCDTDETVFDSF